MRRLRWMLSALLIAGMVLTACGGGNGGTTATEDTATDTATEAEPTAQDEAAEESDDLEELVTAAQDEGQFVLYITLTEVVAERLLEGFEEEYGIQGEYVRAPTTQMLQRLAAEAEAGTYAADVLLTSTDPSDFMEEHVGEGWLQAVPDAGLPVLESEEFPEDFLRGDPATHAIVMVKPWGIAYNPNLVDEAPDWQDLTTPEYRGQVLLPDPSASDAYFNLWYRLMEEYGEEYLSDFAANEPILTESNLPAAQQVAAGEAYAVAPSHAQVVATVQESGAPLEISLPDVTVGLESAAVLIAPDRAPNPAAGRLFVNWIMSPEGNAVLSGDDADGFSVYSDLPAGYTAPDLDEALEAKDRILELLQVGQ